MQNEAINANLAEVKKYIFLAVLFFLVDYVVCLCVRLELFGRSLYLYLIGSMLFEFFYIFFIAKGIFLLSRLSNDKKVLIFCLIYLLIDLLATYTSRIVFDSSISSVIAIPFQQELGVLDENGVLLFLFILSYALFMWSLFRISRGKFFLYSALFFCLLIPFFIFKTYLTEYPYLAYLILLFYFLSFLSFVIAWIKFIPKNMRQNNAK